MREARDFCFETIYFDLYQLGCTISLFITTVLGHRPMYYTKTSILLAVLYGCLVAGKLVQGWQQVLMISLFIFTAIFLDLRFFATIQSCSTRSDGPKDLYQYRKLVSPNYRLLLLNPRWTFDPIKCSLLNGPVIKLLDYEAVSYTWGSPEKSREILVDGCRIKVTASAYDLLLAMSSLWFPKLLWINAICINQEDDVEKDEQVLLMQMIYSSAVLVNVWLGNSSTSHDASSAQPRPGWSRYAAFNQGLITNTSRQKARWAMDILNEIQIVGHGFLGNELEIYHKLARNVSTRFHKLRWDGLIEALQQPWFERIWVVQEVILATHAVIYYGHQTIDWETLAYGLKVLKDHSEIIALLEWLRGIRLRQLQQTTLYNADRINRLKSPEYARDLAELLQQHVL